MASVDQTIVSTALPSIEKDLSASINWSGWTITVYALGQVLVMPLAGRMSDQFGRKKVFLVAAVIFTSASLACGLVGDIQWLLVLRGVQALGGGAFMPSATGIVSDHFGDSRDRALGMFTSIFPIGGIVGPILGGIFVDFWTWRGIFLINVPIGIALVALGIRFIPKSAARSAHRLDIPGVALMGVAILAGMLAISALGNSSVSVSFEVVAIAVALVAGVMFVRHSKRGVAPFIPYRLLHGRGFGAVNTINLFYGAAVLGFGTLAPLYAQQRYGVPALDAGILLTGRAIGMICVAGLAVLALRRTGYRLPMIVGFAIISAGLVLMYLPPPGTMSPVVWLIIGSALTGLGMGLSVPASNNASLQLAPDDIAAIAGLRGMFRQSGGIIGVSVTTAILARSADPGIAQSHILLVFAVCLVLMIPLIFLVPEHHGKW